MWEIKRFNKIKHDTLINKYLNWVKIDKSKWKWIKLNYVIVAKNNIVITGDLYMIYLY